MGLITESVEDASNGATCSVAGVDACDGYMTQSNSAPLFTQPGIAPGEGRPLMIVMGTGVANRPIPTIFRESFDSLPFRRASQQPRIQPRVQPRIQPRIQPRVQSRVCRRPRPLSQRAV